MKPHVLILNSQTELGPPVIYLARKSFSLVRSLAFMKLFASLVSRVASLFKTAGTFDWKKNNYSQLPS